MKAKIRVLALILAFALCLSMSAFAADVTEVSYEAGIKSTLAAGSGSVAFDSENSEKIDVTYAGGEPGEFYLVLMLSGDGTQINKDTILYIDQVTADEDGDVKFGVYPSDMKKGVILIISAGIAGNHQLQAAFVYYMGDANDDGVVTASDAVSIARVAARNEVDGFVQEAADVNQDGKVSVADALLTARYAIGLIPGFENYRTVNA